MQARDAWEEDSHGRETLTRKRWLDSIFELADTWTVGVESLEYATFLRSLFDRTARKEEAGELGVAMTEWRDDSEVVPMPAAPESSEDEDEDEAGDQSDSEHGSGDDSGSAPDEPVDGCDGKAVHKKSAHGKAKGTAGGKMLTSRGAASPAKESKEPRRGGKSASSLPAAVASGDEGGKRRRRRSSEERRADRDVRHDDRKMGAPRRPSRRPLRGPTQWRKPRHPRSRVHRAPAGADG